MSEQSNTEIIRMWPNTWLQSSKKDHNFEILQKAY